jgi:two-component system, OmpR family, response regulator QseB
LRLLLVEDDAQLGRAMQTGLAQQGHAVDWLQDGLDAEAAATSVAYDAILLDLALPRQDGMTLLINLRRGGFAAPILIVTARDDIRDRVSGLDSGADDFIVKPFDMQELGARLRAAQRRASGRAKGTISHGVVSVDPAARSATLDGVAVALTAREFTLLLHLLEHCGQLQTRMQLQDAVSNLAGVIESNAIEVHVHNLRRKLGKDLIRTIHGQGYVVDSLPSAAE